MPSTSKEKQRKKSNRRTHDTASQQSRWFLTRDRVAGFMLACLAVLPFIETLLYNAHVGVGKFPLKVSEYLVLILFIILLWLLMVISFLIDLKNARDLLQKIRGILLKARRLARQRMLMVFVFIPIVLGLVLLTNGPIKKLLNWFYTLQAVLLPFLQMLAVAVLIWLVSALVRATADLHEDLVGAMVSWAFCLRISVGFYLVLTLATLLFLRTDGIQPEARLEFYLVVVKDYFLIFIITGMLYLGLFRLAVARRLMAVFRSFRGFIEFIIICAFIAVIAIWADFNSLNPAKLASDFYKPWQRNYYVVHVYLRDIGLLLLPIAGLLYWTLRRISRELRDEKNKKTAGRVRRDAGGHSKS